MKKNKKLLIGIGIVALLGIVSVGVYRNHQQESESNVIRVGVILPLTGVSSDLGVPILNAMEIAKAQLPLNPTIHQSIRFDVQDGRSTAVGTIAAYQNLLLHKPSTIVVFGDVPCSSLAPLAQKGSVPIIALGAAAANITALCDNYYRMWTTADSSSTVMVDYLHKVNKESVAILYSHNSYGEDFVNCLEQKISLVGIHKTQVESFDVANPDVKAQVQKILSTKPDSVIVIGFGTGYLSVFNQLKALGYNGLVITDETITIPEYYAGVDDQAKDVMFVSTLFDPFVETGPSYDTFIHPYFEKLGKVPNAHAMFGYVTVTTLYDALERVSWDVSRLRDGLQSTEGFDSIIGKLSYDNHRELIVPVVVKRMIGGGKSEVLQ